MDDLNWELARKRIENVALNRNLLDKCPYFFVLSVQNSYGKFTFYRQLIDRLSKRN